MQIELREAAEGVRQGDGDDGQIGADGRGGSEIGDLIHRHQTHDFGEPSTF